MAKLASIILLALPLAVLVMLAGLGTAIHVVATEGRSRSAAISRVLGVLNLAMLVPYGVVYSVAEGQNVATMLVIAGGASACVGLLGLRMPARYRE